MAGKMTPEQKSSNQEAKKLRDRAFRQRRNAYLAEVEAAKQSLEVVTAAQSAVAADDALNAAMAVRDAAIDDIKAQIAALSRKLEETRQAHLAILEPLSAAKTAAWDRKRQMELEAENNVKSKYPDVADCWSAAAWKPYEEFLPSSQ